jgi:hypothetical protein
MADAQSIQNANNGVDQNRVQLPWRKVNLLRDNHTIDAAVRWLAQRGAVSPARLADTP